MLQEKIVVFGRVQGVFFRAFTKKHAEKLGIQGYVKNLDEGAVEIVAIVAKSERLAFETFMKHIARGPVASKVEKVERRELGSIEMQILLKKISEKDKFFGFEII